MCPWSYGSWIYKYLCNQCLSPLMLWVRLRLRAWCTTLWDKVCQWLAAGQWFSLGPPVSSINNTDHHNITEILLKVVLNTIKPKPYFITYTSYLRNEKTSLICCWEISPSICARYVYISLNSWNGIRAGPPSGSAVNISHTVFIASVMFCKYRRNH